MVDVSVETYDETNAFGGAICIGFNTVTNLKSSRSSRSGNLNIVSNGRTDSCG